MNIEFTQFFSGSQGNFYLIAIGRRRLLVEAGVRWPKVLEALNYDLTGINACVCTHEHKDHSKCLSSVITAGIDVYSSAGTLEACGITGHRAKPVKAGDLVRFDGFEILFFDTHHDAAEPLGFILRAGKEFLLFATDTAYIPVKPPVPPTIVAIECSYDKRLLAENLDAEFINEKLARRLHDSHMEKNVCMDYLRKIDMTRCEELHLLHMSKANIDRDTTIAKFEEEFPFIEVKTL